MPSESFLLRGLACASWLVAGCSRELPVQQAAVAAGTVQARAGASLVAAPSGAPVQSPTSRASGVAVLELFTSEGCSSCPPADRILARIAARKTDARAVFPLSFHVDYWNYLGWRDPFSRASYSERQRGYSSISAGGGTYTPQMVVNGQAECVGSNASRIDALIDAALKREARTQITLEARRGEHGIEVSYRVTGDTQARVLNLALVEPHAESLVEDGENAGERLVHVNVVRVFSTQPLSDGTIGHWSPPPDAELQARPVGVVAFAQGGPRRDISGASALELP